LENAAGQAFCEHLGAQREDMQAIEMVPFTWPDTAVL
jgi:hypothetical protein